MWAVSDESLLAGLATGDADAAAALVERFQRRVYGLALTVTGDPRVAEEVAIEAFGRAGRHAADFDPRRFSVVTWLLMITRGLAVDAARLRRSISVDPDGLLPFDDDDPESLLATDDAGRLRVAFAELPDEQRRALTRAAFLGESAREVADAEGIPVATATTRIRAGLLRLRAVLASQERAE
ncbi:MAG: sigma-70 family RNA polymerase sigma factor [Acidimicrobiia bacterium]|nr:sigma-70 family RNA polymerase sigma factor [Acidimicrobiia bacterium]